jgi:hypothetical protein
MSAMTSCISIKLPLPRKDAVRGDPVALGWISMKDGSFSEPVSPFETRFQCKDHTREEIA